MSGSAVIVSRRVAASPAAAFTAFTDGIVHWWQSHPLFPLEAGQIGFEEDRLIAFLADGTLFEVGVVTAWEPGARLALSWRFPSFGPGDTTEVEVTFEPVGEETRVTVTHRGWDSLPPRHAARHGFPLDALQLRLAEHWRALLARLAAG